MHAIAIKWTNLHRYGRIAKHILKYTDVSSSIYLLLVQIFIRLLPLQIFIQPAATFEFYYIFSFRLGYKLGYSDFKARQKPRIYVVFLIYFILPVVERRSFHHFLSRDIIVLANGIIPSFC